MQKLHGLFVSREIHSNICSKAPDFLTLACSPSSVGIWRIRNLESTADVSGGFKGIKSRLRQNRFLIVTGSKHSFAYNYNMISPRYEHSQEKICRGNQAVEFVSYVILKYPLVEDYSEKRVKVIVFYFLEFGLGQSEGGGRVARVVEKNRLFCGR